MNQQSRMKARVSKYNMCKSPVLQTRLMADGEQTVHFLMFELNSFPSFVVLKQELSHELYE